MRVLGIDPGLNISGYGIIESLSGSDMNIIEAGIIRTNAKAEMDNRLVEIGREFDSVLKQFKPDVMAIEELYSHFNHPKTSIIMAHARGLMIFKAAEAGLQVVSYASTRIKKSLTGHGRATKEQMQKAVQTNMGLKSLPEPPDVADALAVAWCHLQAINRTQAVAI
ncbi:MAG: crossover junction endodeoxyribonuclease RuvC [candidate division Zixibacteria bacterium]|nr:crossover junction endodeoxyribonuclease RuvC [candidate division Zixibacteria bacterium]